ncbi:MAG: tripartite tricarboxylate transporter substrate binding protein [Burkholderiales bacterium]
MAFAWCFGITSARAQAYPVKPIRILVGFAGGSDLMARAVAQQLTPVLGQQVIVEARMGAAGNIAFDAAARAAPDGYTLLMGAVPLLTNQLIYRKVTYDPMRDFVPIVLLSTIPNGLFLHPSVPAKTLRELTQLARTAPGKIAYGSGGVGSANHIAAALLENLAKVKFTHIPYKTASLGLVGAMSGEVDMVITVVSSGVSYVKDGRMRGIVVMDSKRSQSMPDLPTSAEAGMPELQAVNWYALMAPAGTPRAIVERLHAESVKVMSPPDVQSRLRALGGEPETRTPDQTAVFLRGEYARWGKVVKEAGIKSE